MPVALIDGRETHYVTSGADGPALLLVHCFGGSSARWRRQFEAFSGDHRVLAADHWGHGDSAPPAEASGDDVERVAADVLALATIAGFDRFHLVGHSLGGAVAQELALEKPERLHSLTLADTTDWFGDHGDLQPPGGPPARQATWDALLRWRGTASRAHQIAVRTLIVHGEDDAAKIIEGSGRLAGMIPRAEYVRIPGAGHGPHIEQPARFNALLRDFLARG